MSVVWLAPAVWWSLAVLAIPIAIHLLTREQRRRVPFPSLRFLRVANPAATRRWRVSDWPLLAARLAVLLAAVTALAAPVFVTPGRTQAWSRRTARAVVTAVPGDATAAVRAEIDRMVETETSAAFRSRVVAADATTGAIADSVYAALAWLDWQPPSAREIVITGVLPLGSIAAGDLHRVPPHVGIRLLPVAGSGRDRDAGVRAIALAPDGTPVVEELRAVFGEIETQVDRRRAGAVAPPIEVEAAEGDRDRAQAALRAVLAEGLLLPHGGERPLTIAFAGATSRAAPLAEPPGAAWMRRALEQLPDLRGGERDGRLVLMSDVRGRDPRAPAIIARAARAAFDQDRRDLEPAVIPRAALAAWERSPGPPPAGARPADEGDRRFFWMLALILLALEYRIRTARRWHTAARETAGDPEQRVA